MTPIWFRPADSGPILEFMRQGIDGAGVGWPETVVLGVFHKEQLVAGVAFHDWQPDRGTIELTFYANRRWWMTRQVLQELTEYAFGTVKCQAVIVRTSERNNRVLKLLRNAGFEMARVPRARGRNEAEIIATLADDVWLQRMRRK